MDSSLELSVGRGLVAHSDGVLGLVHEAALARVMVLVTANGISDFLGCRLVLLRLESAHARVRVALRHITDMFKCAFLRIWLDGIVNLVREILTSWLAHDCDCDFFVVRGVCKSAL